MTEQTWRRITGWAGILIIILAFLLVIERLDWLIYPILGVLPPFVIAFLIAYILDPLLTRLQQRGMTRSRSVLLVSLLFLVIFVGAALYLVPMIAAQGISLAENLPAYAQDVGQAANKLLSGHQTLLHRFNLPTTVSGFLNRFSGQISGAVSAGIAYISNLSLSLIGKVLWLLLVPLLTIYLLGEWEDLRRKAAYLVPEPYRPRVFRISASISKVFSAYIRGQIILAALYGITTAFVLGVFFHMNYSLILGLVAGLVSPIPYVGSAVILISTGVVAFVQNPTWSYVLGVFAAMMIQNNILFDNIVGPRVLGKSVGLNLFWSIFALMLGGAMFGFLGVLLAYPVGAMIQVVICDLFPKICSNPEEEEEEPELPFDETAAEPSESQEQTE